MLKRTFLPLSVVISLLLSAAVVERSPLSQAATPDESEASLALDVKLLTESGVPADSPGLMEFFRKQVMSDEQRRRVADLIQQLGDNDFEVRETATKKLIALGHVAATALRQAQNHRDIEVARRVDSCLNALKGVPPVEVRAAALRVLTVRKSPQAVAVLLAFVPDAEDAAEEGRIVGVLKTLGVRDGNADPALVAALTDKLPLRRSVAAEVLAGVSDAKRRDAVRKLLTDPERAVRLHVAVALVYAGEKEAVPVLIDVVADWPGGQVVEAEDLLRRVAGAKAPPVKPGNDAAARKQFRDEWHRWWKEHAATVKLAGLDAGPPRTVKVRARASATYKVTCAPDRAFDPKGSGWAAGDFAPQWIEADLGTSTPLASIMLNPSQLPVVCATTHEVWVSNEPIGKERTKAKLAHTFKGQTENGKPIQVAFPKGLSARYVQIHTTESESWIAWNSIELLVGRTRCPFMKEEGH